MTKRLANELRGPLSRPQQMSRIRRDNTGPERALRSLLWRRGVRYRLQGRHLPGRPDLYMSGQRLVVFIDGCYWHGCPAHYVRPRTRRRFWAAKLRANVLRDCRVNADLKAAGWHVLRLWEHEVLADPETALRDVLGALNARSASASSWRVLRVTSLDRRGDVERRVLIRLEQPKDKRTETHQRHTRKW